ncbi:tryptophan synthase beta subunit-like PLP-dependent enzyme [Aspergillus undulatus]|uniref:tryptophan synthase beta subunit-like PLP-dependent enzyme n=1 Tax=Aspergillus undulatus TaxID=1810928 RepID=UPI003CCCCE58
MFSRRPIYTNSSSTPQKTTFPQAPGLSQFHHSLESYTPTPLTPLPNFASDLGVRAVLVKDESNRLGLPSFKVLGASWGCYRAVAEYLSLPLTVSLAEMAVRAQEKGVKLLAATKGNHGRAVAFMARQLGIAAEIFVSESMDEGTRGRISGEGAGLRVIQGDYDEAVLEALRVSKSVDSALLIQDTALDGYEEVPGWIVQGYSTMRGEIESQLAELGLRATVMVTPVGVGSLANTVATFCKSREDPISVVAVEPDSAACLQESLLRGELTPIETSYTVMDGMNCGTVSKTAWPNLQRLVDASVTVSCYESHAAVGYLGECSINAGPCGAASLAALKRLAGDAAGTKLLNKDSIVVLLSTEGPRDYPIPHDVSVDDAVRLTGALTKINSSNPTLSVADGVGETQIADYLQAWFAHRGIESHRVEPVHGRPSVVGVLKGSGGPGGKSLMFNGHIDTVSLASYERDALSGMVGTRDGKEVVLGRGSLDMKGGLAASLAAVAAIKASGASLRGDVIIAAVADEEDASQGTQDILAAGWRADAAVVPEPTSEVIARAHKGFVWVEVDILGVAAHGSNHIDGVDAILHAGWFLTALEEYAQRLPIDDVLGPATLHCGLIKGGEEASSYPAKCTITIEFRTVPGQTESSILAEIHNLLVDIQNSKPQFRFAAPRATLTRPPHKIESDHPLITKVADCAAPAAAAVGGSGSETRPPIQSVPFWCDAALLSEAGTPAVVFGPCGHGLHGKEEWVEVESVRRLSGTFERLIREFCA